jgi:hypothetical protein
MIGRAFRTAPPAAGVVVSSCGKRPREWHRGRRAPEVERGRRGFRCAILTRGLGELADERRTVPAVRTDDLTRRRPRAEELMSLMRSSPEPPAQEPGKRTPGETTTWSAPSSTAGRNRQARSASGTRRRSSASQAGSARVGDHEPVPARGEVPGGRHAGAPEAHDHAARTGGGLLHQRASAWPAREDQHEGDIQRTMTSPAQPFSS